MRTRTEKSARPPLRPAPMAKPFAAASTHRRSHRSSPSPAASAGGASRGFPGGAAQLPFTAHWRSSGGEGAMSSPAGGGADPPPGGHHSEEEEALLRAIGVGGLQGAVQAA